MWQKSLLYTVVVLHINSSLQCSPWSLTCSSPRKIRKTIKIEISGGETRWFPHYCPRDCCSVVVMFKWIFENRPVPVCPGRHRLYRAPPDPPRHHDCTYLLFVLSSLKIQSVVTGQTPIYSYYVGLFSSFFFIPFIILALLFSLSLLVVTQIRGHIAGSSPPLPTTVRVLHFYR